MGHAKFRDEQRLGKTKFATAGIAIAMLLAACGGGGEQAAGTDVPEGESDEEGEDAQEASPDGWPHESMDVMIPWGPGGGGDTYTRSIASAIAEELDVDVRYENMEGASSQLGLTHFIQSMPNDGSAMTFAGEMYLTGSIVLNDAEYEVSDFAMINMEIADPSTVTVSSDSEYQTFDDLVSAARERPGELTYGVLHGGGPHLMAVQLADELDLDVRPVFYDGGEEQRNAVLGGHVDYMVGNVSNDSVVDGLRVLAVSADEGESVFELTPEAVSLSQTLVDDYDAESVPSLGSFRGLAMHSTFKEANPELFEMLADAYQTAFNSDEYHELMVDQNRVELSSWRGPDQSDQMLVDNLETMERYADELAADEE